MNSIKKLDENKQATKEWSSLFKSNIDTLVSDVQDLSKEYRE